MNELLRRLQEDLLQQPPALLRKSTVDLLLGNDREIGRERRSQEKRVGVIPEQLKQLKECLLSVGVNLNLFVMAGAGQRAGFSDSDFIAVGAEILTEAELHDHDRPPDVFHALKEPSSYESQLPAPFCRIGAVHGGNFYSGSGLAELLAKRDVAIFDGSNIGAPEAHRIPIRGRMSEFAGEIAAEWISDHLRSHGLSGRVVIVGGGRAGLSAAGVLSKNESVSEIHLFENRERPDRVQEVQRMVSQLEKIKVLVLEGRDDPDLLKSIKGSAGVLFAVAVPGGKAPKVVHVSHLGSLKREAIVVDISIDERGAIYDPSISPEWEASRIIEHLEPSLRQQQIVYKAQENMPRSRAREASKEHGEVILPYIATLLYLAALEGGTSGVRKRLASRPINMVSEDPRHVSPGRVLEALEQDLRNGLAFFTSSNRIVVEEVVPDRVNTLSFLLEREIPFEFSLPLRSSLKKEKVKETETALQLFPEDVREFLQFAFSRGISGSVISHPKKDGTTTKGAAEALGAPPANVLKSLIWKHQNELLAVICSGIKHVDELRLRALTGAGKLSMAKPDEVMRATGHIPGAVPIIGLFKMTDKIKKIYVSNEVLQLDSVYGSAGSVFLGFKFHPRNLQELGAIPADLTPDDSVLRRSEAAVRKIWSDIERAIERDDDKKGGEALLALNAILKQASNSPAESSETDSRTVAGDE